MIKNYVAVLLDKSGSMGYFRDDAITSINGVLESVRSRTIQEGQESLISLYTFASSPQRVYQHVGVSQAGDLSHANYNPSGNTALRDAVGMAIDDLSNVYDANQPNVSFLVIVVTDGQENNSIMSEAMLTQKIAEKQRTKRWTFAFNMPPGHAHMATRYGVPAGNVREWEQSVRGFHETQVENVKGIGTYFTDRSRGATMTASFYDVQSDLSKLKPGDLKKKLVDLKPQFKMVSVPKEESIKDRVEGAGLQYRVGTAYYQLTKKEVIQAHKAVLLMEKGKSTIWGGAQARDLIGLPNNGAGAKVEPGNHANYDIFVQSTSTNRKLVRGTKLLVAK